MQKTEKSVILRIFIRCHQPRVGREHTYLKFMKTNDDEQG